MHRLFFALIAIPVLAQERPVLELSLKQAVEMALTPDGATRMKLARESINAAQARRGQALAALLPNIDGSTTYTNQTVNLRSFGINFSIPGVGSLPAVVGPFSTVDVRATASQSVFDFAAIKRYQAGRLGVEQAKQERESESDATIERVSRSYLATLRSQATVEADRANVTLAEQLLQLAESQKRAGTGTGIEITRARVQLANDKQQLVVAQNELDRASLQLLREIGVNLAATVKLTDTMQYQETPLEPAEQSFQKARTVRSDLKAQETREAVAKINYDSVKWERLPSIAANANYGTIGLTEGPILPTRVYGATMKIPIFDGGRRDARRAEAASQLRSEQIRTRDLSQQVDLELRLAIDGVRAADTQVKTAREGLDLANNEVEQARRRYEAGITTSVELTDAQTRLARARDNYVAALYSHNLARVDLTSAMGTIAQTVR